MSNDSHVSNQTMDIDETNDMLSRKQKQVSNQPQISQPSDDGGRVRDHGSRNDDSGSDIGFQQQRQQQLLQQPVQLPYKRGPGRPRKYPENTTLSQTAAFSNTPKNTPSSAQYSHMGLPPSYNNAMGFGSSNANGVDLGEVQKYMMKKKIKKYVQKYMDKYSKNQLYSDHQYVQKDDDYADDDGEEDDLNNEDEDQDTVDGKNEKRFVSTAPTQPHSRSRPASMYQPRTSSHMHDGADDVGSTEPVNTKLAQILGLHRRRK